MKKATVMVKHMSYSRIIFMGLMFCSCVTDVIFAQSSVQPTVRTPLTVTPEVYSFKQDVFRPISYYTGQANVSVPLYTIETNEISFPIELRYIGGEGLRPLNTYSAVGHGWRLSAGGAITRTVNGVPDESEYYTSSSHLFPDGFFSLPASSITNEYVRNNVNTFFNSEGGFTPYYEYSPDIFTFSFLGYSGYFVMGYDKEFKIVSENIVKVEKGTGVSSSVLYQYSPVSFTLTANDGTKFYFGNQTGSTEISGGNETPAVTEAWYLTKIEFSNGNIINLIYHPNILETEKLLHMKSRYDPENYCTRPVIIKEIVLNNGNVSFISSVKTHTISNTDDYLRLIDRIEVKNNNSNLVSSIDFNYRSKAFDRYHMLYSVKIDNKLYSFIYHNEGLLPAYTPNSSIGTDYWGYYNGQNERYPNYTTMTFTKDMYLNDDNTVYHEKEPSLEHTKAGVLQSIIYPTGAHEEFEYELHTYYRYYANSLNGPYMKSESQYAQAGGLRIKKIITDNITRTFEYGSNGILYKKPVVAYWTATALNELSIEGEPHVTYSSVTERRSDGSSTAYDMNSHLDINDGSNATMSNFYDGLSSQSSLFSYHPVPAFINAFGKASSRSLERGQIKKISVYDSSSNLIKSTTYSYSRNPDRYLQYVAAIKIFTAADKYIQPFVMELAKEYGYADLMFTFHHSYCIYTFPVHLEKKITTYYSGNNTTTQTVTYYHNEQKLLSKTTTHNSAGDSLYTTFKYPNDYSTLPYTSMVDKNILSPVIEEITSVKNGIETERTKVNYTHKTGNLYVPFSTQHSFSGENNLITTNTYLYDIKGNILQTTSHDATIKSVIWGYNGQYPIATIENAPYNDVAYTSFEDNYAGNSWTFGGFAFGGEVNTVNQHTGTKSFTMSGNTGSITKRDLTPNKTYIVSYWSRNGVLYVNIPNNLTTGITINGWVYYEHIFTTSLSSTTISITSNNISNGGEIIDELRLYPADAKITTYTYKPLVGITSKTDTSGHTIYYEYDGFGRLKQIKDDSGNIIKHYEYHYQDETP